MQQNILGFVIASQYKEWNPKDIKFRLYCNGVFKYALLDRTVKTGEYKLIDDNILYLEDVSVDLVKRVPEPTLSKEEIATKLVELNSHYCKRLSPRTAIIKLPSFEYQHLSTMDSLIESNRLLLESENLIIDLRGNPGGTTDAYKKLLHIFQAKSSEIRELNF